MKHSVLCRRREIINSKAARGSRATLTSRRSVIFLELRTLTFDSGLFFFPPCLTLLNSNRTSHLYLKTWSYDVMTSLDLARRRLGLRSGYCFSSRPLYFLIDCSEAAVKCDLSRGRQLPERMRGASDDEP